MTFFVIFSKIFSESKIKFFFHNLEFLALKFENVRGLSGVANLDSKYKGSSFCSFRDMAFFLVISKKT